MPLSWDHPLIKLVKNEVVKPAPTAYPPLLPTLQTTVGMVLHDGAPRKRDIRSAPASQLSASVVETAVSLRAKCPGATKEYSTSRRAAIDCNLQACSAPVTKEDLLGYISQGKRLDTEQAVAMIIAYLQSVASEDFNTKHESDDDFEGRKISVVHQLINDPGTLVMLRNTCMWREPYDFTLQGDPRDLAIISKKNKILKLLGEDAKPSGPSATEFFEKLQDLRRQRRKLNHIQHLVLPEQIVPDHGGQDNPWQMSNHYKRGTHSEVPSEAPTILSKNMFRRIQRLLNRLNPPSDPTSRYVYYVQEFIKSSGRLSENRIATLRECIDPYAIAYGFITAQRHCQLKVVSEHGWKRFLVKGEGALLLQNCPHVLTSFEDILVRHATDLVALTAISCPQGLRDHFSVKTDILKRARKICEFMERYVKTFAPGENMAELVFDRNISGGSGRGPVDFYNALCDQLADCRRRAKAAGVELRIGPVYKFLAKDIMAYNTAWNDDAFAAGKVPGWVEYLARVRHEEKQIEEDGWTDDFEKMNL